MAENDGEFVENRRFFRVQDEISLVFTQVDAEYIQKNFSEVAEHLDDGSLGAALEVLNQESLLILGRIERASSDLAEYLKIVENKINLVAQSIIRENNALAKAPLRHVSLSASGLECESEVAHNKGELLKIELLLPSSLAAIVCYAHIVYYRENTLEDKKHPFIIGMEFSHIREKDREIIIKHVVKRQMQQIRENKEE